jgi:branched-chain amino acid transport system ATP-binding protein
VAAPLLRLTDVHAGYGPIEVLRGISLEVRAGEIVTLIGANGAGKTTTLMCISGVNRAGSGSIVMDGRDVTRLPPHGIMRLGIAQAPEGRKIFPRLSVIENLEMGAFAREDGDGVRADLERCFSLFPILRERRAQPGGTLSGGEQQMLAIARALMGRPRLLLLDEPSLGLAPLVVARIFEVIRDLHRQGISILLVEQNARLALRLADRGYVLETGRLVREGDAEDLLLDPRVREAYLGEA